MLPLSTIKDLNILEINILLGHVRLGEAHLKKYLNAGQFNELLALGILEEDQAQSIKSDKAEKSGTVALVINTIITSIFGAWMGFSGFMGLSLDSVAVLLSMTLLALLVSSFVGYYSFKQTQAKARSTLTKQKLYKL